MEGIPLLEDEAEETFREVSKPIAKNWVQYGEGWRSRSWESESSKDHSEWDSALPLPDLVNVICLLTASFYQLESKDINNNTCLLKYIDTKGGKQGVGTNWEIGVDVYTLIYIK